MSKHPAPGFSVAPNPPQRALRLHRELARVWGNAPGWRGQITAVNHTTLGLRFMATALVFFAIGGILAMMIRAQLATPAGAFLDTELYNQIFTMHGSIMMFLFAIPMLEGLGMYLLPKMLGTRDMAFPRLTAFGYWCYLFGGLILLISLILGVAPLDGWFMYTPLSGSTYSPGINADIWLLGITFVEISAVAAAIEIIVTILRQRPPAMTLTRMPLFAWYMLATGAMMLVGFPPLILASVLLEIERAFDWPFFEVARGGDPLLWQHLFWLFGHPEVYIIFLPAAGAISTILPVMCRTQIVGYTAIVAAVLALLFLSFGLWVHHMFAVGIPHMALAFFSAASMAVAVPTAVQIFAWIGTMWKGRPELHLPMLHILGFFLTFVMGGLTGVMVAIVPFNWQAHDTAFITAHLHYVLIGGFVFPMMAAASYWMPLFSGRDRVKGLGEVAFFIILIGFHGTFFIMHLTGLLGMPRRIDIYPDNPEWIVPNLISSISGFVLTIGFGLFALDMALQAVLGPRSKRDPWRGQTLDWAMITPAPAYNFASLPLRPMLPNDQARDIALALGRGEGLLPGAPRGRREVVVTDIGTGKPQHIAFLPPNSTLPLMVAVAIGVFVLLMLAQLYVLTPLALAGVVILTWRWAREQVSAQDHDPVHVSPGLVLPVQYHWRRTLVFSGMVSLLVADGAMFGSLLFGVGFLSVVTQGPPAPLPLTDGILDALLAAAIVASLAIASLAMRRVETRLRRNRAAGGELVVGLAANLLALALLLALSLTALHDPSLHARDALRAVLAGYVGLHAAVAAIFAGFGWWQGRCGELSATRTGGLANAKIWQDYTTATALIAAATVIGQGVLA